MNIGHAKRITVSLGGDDLQYKVGSLRTSLGNRSGLEVLEKFLKDQTVNLLTVTDAPRGWKQASLHLATGEVFHFSGRTTKQAREAAYLWIVREREVLEPLKEL